MKMIAPNIARPITKPIEEATLKTRERKSLSGMTGSAARVSTRRKIASSTLPTIASATITGESHWYSLPPQVVTQDQRAHARR